MTAVMEMGLGMMVEFSPRNWSKETRMLRISKAILFHIPYKYRFRSQPNGSKLPMIL